MTDFVKNDTALRRIIEADAEFDRARTLLIHASMRAGRRSDRFDLDLPDDVWRRYGRALAAWPKARDASTLHRIERQLGAPPPRTPATVAAVEAAIAELKPIVLELAAAVPAEIRFRIDRVARVRAAKADKKSVDLERQALDALRGIAQERGETLSQALRAVCDAYRDAPKDKTATR